MNTPRPFAADSNKFAYAQVFSRTSTARRAPSGDRAAVRGLGAVSARLHRAAKPTR